MAVQPSGPAWPPGASKSAALREQERGVHSGLDLALIWALNV